MTTALPSSLTLEEFLKLPETKPVRHSTWMVDRSRGAVNSDVYVGTEATRTDC